jgi:hypothetical protein
MLADNRSFDHTDDYHPPFSQRLLLLLLLSIARGVEAGTAGQKKPGFIQNDFLIG